MFHALTWYIRIFCGGCHHGTPVFLSMRFILRHVTAAACLRHNSVPPLSLHRSRNPSIKQLEILEAYIFYSQKITR